LRSWLSQELDALQKGRCRGKGRLRFTYSRRGMAGMSRRAADWSKVICGGVMRAGLTMGGTKLRKLSVIGYAPVIAVALVMVTLAFATVLATTAWADWCNGRCY
jgi:hypothetical protein